MTHTIFSLKALAACWAGLLVALGSGAVALELSEPAPAPPTLVAAVSPPAVLSASEPPAAVAPSVAPMPFENRSLVALLPPPSHMPPLPVPPRPPIRHVSHVEPHRVMPVYAAARVPYYEPSNWGRAMRYQISRYQPYGYAAPPAYYGW